MPSFSTQSQARLSTCDFRLQRIFNEVIKHIDCTIIEGHRNKERQDAAYNAGKSKVKWPNSKHNKSPSLAVDVMPWYKDKPHIRWDISDKQTAIELHRFAGFVQGVAAGMGIPIKWGGSFNNFFDGPHYELTDV